MMYLLLLLHICIQILFQVRTFWEPDCIPQTPAACTRLPAMDWKPVATITGLLTFFLVFYGGQSYSRFQMFYADCVGLNGMLMNWTCLVRLHLPAETNVQWNAVRLILASMHILYYALHDDDHGVGPPISESEWRTITRRGLLSPGEVAAIKSYGGYKPFLPLMWALGEVEDALLATVAQERGGAGADATVASHMMERFRISDLLSNFRELAFTFRGHCGEISNWMNQPVPYPYFHILSLLLVLDLCLIGYALVLVRRAMPDRATAPSPRSPRPLP